MVWFFPGASWFYHQLIPSASPVPVAPLEPEALMAIWQLINCGFGFPSRSTMFYDTGGCRFMARYGLNSSPARHLELERGLTKD